MRKQIAIVFTLACLAGCITEPYVKEMNREVKQGDCEGAIKTVTRSGQLPAKKSFLVSGIYLSCQKDQAKAIEWATLGARYGSLASRNYLTSVGSPLPPSDLTSFNNYSTDADALFYNLGYAIGTR
jgi:hypothetical protein